MKNNGSGIYGKKLLIALKKLILIYLNLINFGNMVFRKCYPQKKGTVLGHTWVYRVPSWGILYISGDWVTVVTLLFGCMVVPKASSVWHE